MTQDGLSDATRGDVVEPSTPDGSEHRRLRSERRDPRVSTPHDQHADTGWWPGRSGGQPLATPPTAGGTGSSPRRLPVSAPTSGVSVPVIVSPGCGISVPQPGPCAAGTVAIDQAKKEVSMTRQLERANYRITFLVLLLGASAYALLQTLVIPALPTIQHDLHTTQNTVTWVVTVYLLSASIFTPIMGRVGDMVGKERMLVATLVALAAGSVVAGPIISHLSYHWLFWFPLVIIVLAAICAQLFVPESPVRTAGRINWPAVLTGDSGTNSC